MRLAAIAFALVLAFLAPSASASPTVSVVYFYPNDQGASMAVPEVNAIMADVQGWYADQGVNFGVSEAEFIEGQGDTAYYQQNIWGNVLRELGYYCGTGVHVIIVHPSIGFTGGGSCDGGTAMIEEDIFAGEENRPFNGVVAHELGHAFGLPHSEDCGSVMHAVCWIYYPDIGLTDAEVQQLQFEEPEPEPCEPKFNRHGRAIGPKRCR